MQSVERLPIVGVMGSGRAAHDERARVIGSWLATVGVHLLTGGGGGVMQSVSRAFCEVAVRRGRSIGIVPAAGADGAARSGYPNPWVEIAIYTHLPLTGAQGTEPLSRNHLNVLSSTVIIALPGSAGTASEVALALGYGRPLVAYLDARSDIEGLPEAVYVEPDLDAVKAFVTAQLAAVPSAHVG